MKMFSISEDLERYREIGEEKRPDLEDFVKYKEFGHSEEDTIRIPFKVVELPGFEYDMRDMGRVGQGSEPGDGDEKGDDSSKGEPGDSEEQLDFEEMDLEEFAEEMEDALELDLEPKGKKKIKTKEGDYIDRASTGPKSTLVKKTLFKEGLKRSLALTTDKKYCKELLKVTGIGPRQAFEILRENNVRINYEFLEEEYENMSQEEKTTWENFEEFNENNSKRNSGVVLRQDKNGKIVLRREDEEFHYPEEVLEEEKSVVIVNIRDVSGSMKKNKRELVERVFAPIDWTLAGKYDKAEFVYIAHNLEAFEVDREEFFNVRSGGGTKISSGYELAQEILEKNYPWSEWNRYVLAGGDGENSKQDSKDEVIPLMEQIDANLHAYLQVSPSRRSRTHLEILDNYADLDNYVGTQIDSQKEVWDAIKTVFKQEVKNND